MDRKLASLKLLAALASILVPTSLVTADPSLFVSCTGSSTNNASYQGLASVDQIQPGGSSQTIVSGLNISGPSGIAFDANGNLDYVCLLSQQDNQIRSYSFQSGTSTVIATGIPWSCNGLAIDNSGNFYVPNIAISSNLNKVTPNGTVTVIAPLTGDGDALGLAFGSNGNLYLSTVNGIIYEMTPGGSLSPFVTANQVGCLAFDDNGNLFISDFDAGTIDEISPSGQITPFASGLADPEGLAFDGSGNLFVADYGDGTIDEITPTGTVSQYASGLVGPTNLAFAPVPEPASISFIAFTGFFLIRRKTR